MKVLHAASEIRPLAKTGGLADVCAALPEALREQGADVRVFMPAYDSALEALDGGRVVADLGTILGAGPARLVAGRLPDSGLVAWLLDCPALYRRPGTPYQDGQGRDWPDNDLRFAVFCHAVALFACGAGTAGWRPEVVHCHDWPVGLAPYLIGRLGRGRPRSVFTIHNAAFQGNFPLERGARLGIAPDALRPEGLEFYGQLSFMKAGIRYADRITTVSPTYARELCTPEFGCGMDGLIRARAADFEGILNGIDTGLWNPETDTAIAARYSSDSLEGKAECKADLQQGAGLRPDPGAPIVAFASRLTHQKMADVTLARLPRLLERHPRLQFAMVSGGDAALESGFAGLAGRFPGRVSAHLGYAEPLERRLHAGADILLHGSRFEPCGLAHRYAMRYGALPVVRRVGGLADTVSDEENGFAFDEASGAALEGAVDRAIERFGSAQWRPMQQRAMHADSGWRAPARRYAELYRRAARATAPEPEPLTAPG